MKSLSLLFISLLVTSCSSADAEKYQTVIDTTTASKVNHIIETKVIPNFGKLHGELVSDVSSGFLNTPYQGGTLIGSSDTPESLVANFNGVDCFTLIDYVEALTRSRNKHTFLINLAKTRYIDGKVRYLSRRHFFSDWFATQPYNARDVTTLISPYYLTEEKQLNRKPDGGEYIQGLGIIPRKINYIPGNAINDDVLRQLRNGDYVGVYSPLKGLDVSHTGIVIKVGRLVWFRNASSLSANRKVVDSPFMEYMSKKPGFIVLRAQ
ncbi:DUF1460 domain-containing protein [Lonsdalea iberica]